MALGLVLPFVHPSVTPITCVLRPSSVSRPTVSPSPNVDCLSRAYLSRPPAHESVQVNIVNKATSAYFPQSINFCLVHLTTHAFCPWLPHNMTYTDQPIAQTIRHHTCTT